MVVALTVNSQEKVQAIVETAVQESQGGNSVTLRLGQGDVVVIKRNKHTHGNRIEGSEVVRATTFSGFLIFPVEMSPIVGK